jgi:isoleucyl-tRNA synthetase
MALKPLEGYEVEAEAGHAVALQLEIDEELRREGLAREIVRAVQDARKNAGLEVTDRIALALAGAEELVDVAGEHQAYIEKETLAESVALGEGNGDAGSVANIDGHELRISVSPV